MIAKAFPQRPLFGDYLVMLLALLLVAGLFQRYWHLPAATRLEVRQGSHVLAIYSLNQDRRIAVTGPLGVTQVEIHHGRARISASPCVNQYCVHQGWLSHQGEASLCLPNRVSIQLLGAEKLYDSLNY